MYCICVCNCLVYPLLSCVCYDFVGSTVNNCPGRSRSTLMALPDGTTLMMSVSHGCCPQHGVSVCVLFMFINKLISRSNIDGDKGGKGASWQGNYHFYFYIWLPCLFFKAMICFVWQLLFINKLYGNCCLFFLGAIQKSQPGARGCYCKSDGRWPTVC